MTDRIVEIADHLQALLRNGGLECGLAAMEFRLKVDHEDIELRFT